ncbi:50S ribosomal protein L30e [Methanogenium cariaci]|uniref:50S ribosomal protein L30e n=1 Tax=Methanogenium cariaci TaxID=2197 RepID=UPI000783C7DA|nr:50S ribosomal protein L30e [Methanogenium cariaci]
MDFESSLRRAIKTGKVLSGQKSTKECIENKTAQMVVVAKNCPEEYVKYLSGGVEDTFVYTYDGSSVMLGKSCGRPHMVSALAIVDAGESDILTLKRA